MTNTTGTPGTASEPVRYIGAETADLAAHDGRLRLAVGAHNYQVLRANRTQPEQADGYGWTYNHAPMLAYWRGRFYLEYISDPVSEHMPPAQTMLVSSDDGRVWSRPQLVFPPYDSGSTLMHQRMGFFSAPDGRLLIVGFYGFAPAPNDGSGIGRVVREILPDGSFGPIFFLRYNRHAGWDESNTSYPLYREAPDAGFVAACDALLADRLVTLQWWEEDRSPDGFYAVEGLKALASYQRADGTIVGLWKGALSALSSDGGTTWSQAVPSPTIITSGAKVWGQRTADGRYVLAYNPVADNNHRWPLAIVTGDDGVSFDQLATVHGEVPWRRYAGTYKDFGPQYVRGIEAYDRLPDEQALWLAYSVNKEDLWVSRVPLPVCSTVHGPVCDTFDEVVPGPDVPLWNIYSPRWAQVAVVAFPSATDHSLELRDQDPYDYARAIRVFPEYKAVRVTFRLYAHQADGQLEIEIQDRYGARPVRIHLRETGELSLSDGAATRGLGRYQASSWYQLQIDIDAAAQGYRLTINGDEIIAQAAFAEQVSSVERLSFRTGPHRTEPSHSADVHALPDQPGADEATPPMVFNLDDITIVQAGYEGA